jgi:hypothetical protein
MSEMSPNAGTRGYSPARDASGGPAPANLADILERVLDKGIIIAGDIQVNLLDIELLTIRIRLLIVSVDKAQEMGIDWWRHDAGLTSTKRELEDENRDLRERVEALESQAGQAPARTRKRS